MLSKKMIELLILHADQLAASAVEDLRTNDRTPYYHGFDSHELKRRIKSIFKNLENWLAENARQQVSDIFFKFGEVRYFEGVPLPDLVYALILVKRRLTEFMKKTGGTDSAVYLYQAMQFHETMVQFFEDVIYFTVKGYQHSLEEEGRRQQSSAQN
jgi:hypothetical protein